MVYVINNSGVPTCKRAKPYCNYDCEHCGVDYSQAIDEDEENEQENIHDDGYGTHW
jgi:MoaA/NifB/PqqE/SkfB family radical SAM enzyme